MSYRGQSGRPLTVAAHPDPANLSPHSHHLRSRVSGPPDDRVRNRPPPVLTGHPARVVSRVYTTLRSATRPLILSSRPCLSRFVQHPAHDLDVDLLVPVLRFLLGPRHDLALPGERAVRPPRRDRPAGVFPGEDHVFTTISLRTAGCSCRQRPHQAARPHHGHAAPAIAELRLTSSAVATAFPRACCVRRPSCSSSLRETIQTPSPPAPALVACPGAARG